MHLQMQCDIWLDNVTILQQYVAGRKLDIIT